MVIWCIVKYLLKMSKIYFEVIQCVGCNIFTLNSHVSIHNIGIPHKALFTVFGLLVWKMFYVLTLITASIFQC